LPAVITCPGRSRNSHTCFHSPLGSRPLGHASQNAQARWALAVITGRTTWSRTHRLPRALRRLLCDDLGWPCLWASTKVAAVALYEKCRSDYSAFAHARLSNDGSAADGGWLHAAQNTFEALHVPPWTPETNNTASAAKASLARYRKEVIQPAVLYTSEAAPGHPPLPWAWLALNADRAFPASAFEMWWQIRVLGQSHPRCRCSWCMPTTPLTRMHLQLACVTFAEQCLVRGVQPEEAFMYPGTAGWFIAALQAIHCTEEGSAARDD